MSPDTVEYQIKNLVERKQLCSLSTLFNYHSLGYLDYHYVLRFKDISIIPLDELKELPFVTFINTCYGGYDLQIIFVAKNFLKVKDYLKQINSLLGTNIQDYFFVSSGEFYKYSNILPEFNVPVKLPKNQKNVIYTLNNENYADVSTSKLEIDNLDRKLVFELINNPLKSYLQLGKKFGVSRETIRYRIENFVKKGFIRSFFIKPNYTKMGYFTNFLFVKFAGLDDTKLKEYFVNNKNVFYVGRLTGSYNAIIYTLTKTPDELSNLIRNFRIEFKEHVIDLLLLHFDKVIKEVQFPENV